ncbi:MAG TPA: helix-turn-helix transcriptional regulator [Clostridia bacterium]|nr:helix-turn-helix transcriptional regulator [Clostridia bacterium]
MKNRVRELREAKGLTQEQLAKKMGVSRQTIISIETGRYNPSLILAHGLAREFGKHIEDIFDFPNPEGGIGSE